MQLFIVKVKGLQFGSSQDVSSHLYNNYHLFNVYLSRLHTQLFTIQTVVLGKLQWSKTLCPLGDLKIRCSSNGPCNSINKWPRRSYLSTCFCPRTLSMIWPGIQPAVLRSQVQCRSNERQRPPFIVSLRQFNITDMKYKQRGVLLRFFQLYTNKSIRVFICCLQTSLFELNCKSIILVQCDCNMRSIHSTNISSWVLT